LESEWYGAIVEYRLFARDQGDGSKSARKRLEKKAADFRLVDKKGAVPRLAYVERDGSQSWCLHPEQVNEALQYAHDCHGHFADAITLKRLMGKFYWPTRAKDTPVFCRSCANCQYFGPRRPSQLQKPILHLQPLDMVGIDYLGPFNPVSAGTNSKYVILVVDYFSRFAWARAVEHNDGETAAQFLLEEVVKTFGWPSAVYSDNGSHFVQGKLPALFKEHGVRHFPAPKSHPSSVGLIEKYVQLILYSLRRYTLLVDGGKYLWDRYLPLIVNNINDRVLKVHGYSPSQLLFGITPRRSGWDITPSQEHIADGLARLYENDPYFASLAVEESNVAIRLAAIDEARARCLDRLERSHHAIVDRESRKARWTAPKIGDLVLMRNMALDGQHGHKLQARWEGPYMLDDIHPNGRAGRLRDIHTGALVKVKASGAKERVHLDDLKVFVPRVETSAASNQVEIELRNWSAEVGRLAFDLDTW
jgi:transposase InsO family protein